jgi:hypothetical protein
MMFNIRPAVPDDSAFIRDSWVRSAKSLPANRHIPPDCYYPRQAMCVTNALMHSAVSIACDPEDASIIFGYVVVDGPTFHWAFTKADLRGFGICRALLADFDLAHCTFTHYPKPSCHLLCKYPEVRYDPFIFYGAPPILRSNKNEQREDCSYVRTTPGPVVSPI